MFRQRVITKGLGVALVAGFALSAAFAQATVNVAEHEEYGAHLVTGEGLTLYAYVPDGEAEGSACTGACAQVRPPFTTDGDPQAGDGVDGESLGTIEREGGDVQVTYDGWPLYRYLQDRAEGDVKGQGQGDNWYVVAADGTLVGADLEPSGEEGDGAGEAADGDGQGAEDVDFEALMAQGQQVYENLCAGCHGVNGDEANGSHVAVLTEVGSAMSDPLGLSRQIIYGGAYMPGFGEQLSNEEVQAVATYVRNSFDHDFGPVTREEVVTERERFD